jgi:glutamine synthetase
MKTFAILPYSPAHARVMGDMVRDGKPWPYCPRNFLKRMIAMAASAGIEVMAAFENEFYLLHPSVESILPADTTPFASSRSMDLHQPLIDMIADMLFAQGIGVEQYYSESGPGQQEISMLYTHALSAADQQIIFRETVHAVAGKHRLRASFLPKLFADQAGSGCHLHISLWKEGSNLVPAPDGSGDLSSLARQFMAGILHHLPALMALTTPSTNSYRRIRPHCWSGAFRCWGWDNREGAIRVPTHPEAPAPTHFELKTVDASANPYLALGAVIGAGLDGVKRQLELPDPVSVDPGVIPEAERIARGIDGLPTSLRDSINALEKDTVLLNALGHDLARAYLAVRRAEWETMKDWEAEKEVSFLLDRY